MPRRKKTETIGERVETIDQKVELQKMTLWGNNTGPNGSQVSLPGRVTQPYLGIETQGAGPRDRVVALSSLDNHGSRFDESQRGVLSAPVQLIRLPGPIRL